jgi:hypothetical protein
MFFIINTSSVNAKMYKILDSEGNIIRLTNNPVLSIKEKGAGYTVFPPPEIKQEALSKGNNYDFLNTNWGMSKEEVKKMEKAGFIEANREREDDLQYKGKVDGLDCYMTYSFVEGKLVRTSCAITQSIVDKRHNIWGCYYNIKEYFIKKYGEIFKETEFSTSWDTSITKVDLFLSIGNKDFDLLIDCKSKSEPELNPEKETSNGFNYFRLQSQMNDVLKDDPRNNGVEVSVYYGNYVNPSILIYDLKSISKTNSMADVFRVFLQFSEKVQSKKFDVVELSFMGKTKFRIKGDYFQTLGKEYSWQNPVYTIRTFPKNLINLDGSMAYPEWTGGWLGVARKQMEDFNDFHKKWYLEDIAKEWST